MSDEQSIFEVKITKVTAELEISNSKIRCITGNTTHFDILKENLRAVQKIEKNKILLHFHDEDNQLTQCTISSKYAEKIIELIISQK